MAISGNIQMTKDPEIRAALLASGQNSEVWINLLASSVDAAETSKILGYLAQKNPKRAALSIDGNLPAGTRIPRSLLSKIITSPLDKENRIRLAAGLPKIVPTNDPLPLLPEAHRTRKI